jgi:hypothetical protein
MGIICGEACFRSRNRGYVVFYTDQFGIEAFTAGKALRGIQCSKMHNQVSQVGLRVISLF